MKALSGYKTYIFIILFFITATLESQGFIPDMAQPYMQEIYLALLTGAGISLRLGIKSATK